MKITVVETGDIGSVSGANLNGKYFLICRLAFKPVTDDMLDQKAVR